MPQCAGCPSAFSYSVGVVVTNGTTLTLTVSADTCCGLTQSKTIKAVLVDALCQYISANRSTLLTNNPDLVSQTDEKCCRLNAFKDMTFNVASKRLVVTGSTTGLSGATVTSSAPWAEVNT